MEEKNNTYKSGYGKRPLWQWIILYLIIGALIYGVIYYLAFPKQNSYNAPAPAGNNSSSSNQPQSAASNEINITGTEFAFTPATITVKKGQPVKVNFTNNGKYPHNWNVTDLNVQTKTIQPGESDSISFTPDKTGSFEFTCTVPGHADRGMKGTLTVQ